MDKNTKNLNKKYDRVMPRVYNRSRLSLKSGSLVIRHGTPSSVRLGGKPSVSNVSPSVFSELPTVLNDYNPEPERPVKRTFVVKPRRTVKSLDPALSPARPAPRPRELNKKSHVRAEASAPSVLTRDREKWSDSHVKQCYSSRSHSKLKELKEEIHEYNEREKLMKLRSHLYQRCGVVLDDVGLPAADKAIQVGDTGMEECFFVLHIHTDNW
ncbi:Uncharacterized protein OBRU01_02562 [Operophtera brumata]|uniref:Uncharacterized protein n=1 Tax=Operophtera brumata TaxID=104452 RepID=A0A0L7LSG3_OPEBR|nr:Uncharacterized protein OBRU01_02562 [Operophtera brumata]